MSPEMLNESPYNTMTDIWSLGITALQMAEGKPPHSEKPQGRAMLAILNDDPPSLKEPEKWSPEFNDFVQKCLNRDPLLRPTAAELLQHPFLSKVSDDYELFIIMEYKMRLVNQVRERNFSIENEGYFKRGTDEMIVPDSPGAMVKNRVLEGLKHYAPKPSPAPPSSSEHQQTIPSSPTNSGLTTSGVSSPRNPPPGNGPKNN
jgi:serine/threonine-protein kinase 10